MVEIYPDSYDSGTSVYKYDLGITRYNLELVNRLIDGGSANVIEYWILGISLKSVSQIFIDAFDSRLAPHKI